MNYDSFKKKEGDKKYGLEVGVKNGCNVSLVSCILVYLKKIHTTPKTLSN